MSNERTRSDGESTSDRDEAAESAGTAMVQPGRADRHPDEGPGVGGGSALAADEPAADEEVGGGD